MMTLGQVDAVSLPMYDFPEVRTHTDELYRAIAAELRARGVDTPPCLQRDIPTLRDHWLDPALLLSQSCGYPVVAQLDGQVSVVGSWATVVDAPNQPGWYQSYIVSRAQDAKATSDDLGSLVRNGLWLGANGPDSLSGWVSLAVYLHDEVGLTDELLSNEVPVVITGSHVATMAAIQAGDADLGSIDSWTYYQLRRWRPEAIAGLTVVARGPLVAVTPLITRLGGPVEKLRAALAAVVSDQRNSETLSALGICGFVPHGAEAHEPVRELVDRCEPTVGLLRRVI